MVASQTVDFADRRFRRTNGFVAARHLSYESDLAMRHRDEQQSHPILDSRDDPRAISPADFEAHLAAHRLLEQRLNSDPVKLEKGPNGLVVSGGGKYIIALAALALVAFVAWLWLH